MEHNKLEQIFIKSPRVTLYLWANNVNFFALINYIFVYLNWEKKKTVVTHVVNPFVMTNANGRAFEMDIPANEKSIERTVRPKFKWAEKKRFR